jgi:hypothetical protein
MEQREWVPDSTRRVALACLCALACLACLGRGGDIRLVVEARAAWSSRLGVTPPTLLRMERGGPKVSMGAYATALWLIGRSDQLPQAAAPHRDFAAAEAEARKVVRTLPARAKSR